MYTTTFRTTAATNTKADSDGNANAEVDETKTTGQIGVAFDLNAVENLYVTVGARFGIADKDEVPNYLKMAFTAGASYQVSEQMKFSVDGGYIQYQDDCTARNDELVDNVFFVGAGVDYTIMDGLSLAADVRYMSNGKGADKKVKKRELPFSSWNRK